MHELCKRLHPLSLLNFFLRGLHLKTESAFNFMNVFKASLAQLRTDREEIILWIMLGRDQPVGEHQLSFDKFS